MLNLSLFNFNSDYFYLKVMIVIFCIFKILANRQTSGLKFHYNKHDRLILEFLDHSKIKQLVYRPYWLTITPLLQSITIYFSEMYFKFWHKFDFDREVVMTSDGGTLAIDWARDLSTGAGRPKASADKSKPIILMAPGLGGSTRNFYTLNLLYQARKQGFKVGTMVFRGSESLPLTSGKICYSGSWEDCKTLIEHVHNTYLAKERQAGKKARLYAYGCSLGAQILGLYLIKEKSAACKYLDGAILYGTPWSTFKGEKFFYENAFGFYQKVIGLTLSATVRKELLPQLRKYVSEEDYEFYKRVLETNWSGLKAFDEHIFPRMFGYANKQEYYEAVSLAERVTDIKVPTFALGASDDQICGHMFAPTKAAQSPESRICFGTTDYGAHVCHLYGHLIPKPWYTKPCLEFLQFIEARSTFRKKEE